MYLNKIFLLKLLLVGLINISLSLFKLNKLVLYFFDKNISAKVEYSKNWATSNLEDISSVKLNREHLLVTMSMRY